MVDHKKTNKKFTIKDLPKEERPRERLFNFGEKALSTEELLQIVLGKGVPGESVALTAKKLISTFGSLEKIAQASLEELQSIRGIGLAKATQIKASLELGRRLYTKPPSYKSKDLNSPKKVFNLIRSKLTDHSKEHFYLIALNTRMYSVAEISIGILNKSLVHPREVFAEAIKSRAASIILVHNHPSGDPTPSKDDVLLTQKLVAAGKLLGIEVTDHVIVTKDNFFSFKAAELI
jgi:DNA repair protein RadC